MTRSQFESVDNYLKPAAMLKLLIVEDEDEELVSGYLKKYDPYTDGAIAYENIAEYAQAHMDECSQGFVSGKNYFRSDITADADKYAFFAVHMIKHGRRQSTAVRHRLSISMVLWRSG